MPRTLCPVPLYLQMSNPRNFLTVTTDWTSPPHTYWISYRVGRGSAYDDLLLGYTNGTLVHQWDGASQARGSGV